ncbi:hypothetical protein GPLA_2465 [Paraglaciecola polaris LMG 21857]|uniref:Uncharacterized protein n=1 Tax=Paraglaciecola polaris LMG 21857 TaxID=1129793 RepID=K6ZSV9_9ALTE|nr:hypothetical protein GPLA_2465 [Paraglaciecola polaris LMG 21857]
MKNIFIYMYYDIKFEIYANSEIPVQPFRVKQFHFSNLRGVSIWRSTGYELQFRLVMLFIEKCL